MLQAMLESARGGRGVTGQHGTGEGAAHRIKATPNTFRSMRRAVGADARGTGSGDGTLLPLHANAALDAETSGSTASLLDGGDNEKLFKPPPPRRFCTPLNLAIAAVQAALILWATHALVRWQAPYMYTEIRAHVTSLSYAERQHFIALQRTCAANPKISPMTVDERVEYYLGEWAQCKGEDATTNPNCSCGTDDHTRQAMSKLVPCHTGRWAEFHKLFCIGRNQWWPGWWQVPPAFLISSIPPLTPSIGLAAAIWLYFPCCLRLRRAGEPPQTLIFVDLPLKHTHTATHTATLSYLHI